MSLRLSVLIVVLLSLILSSYSYAIDFTNTPFERAGSKYGIDPALIYSIALVESARTKQKINVAPWPWTLRTLKYGPVYSTNKTDSLNELKKIISLNGNNVDIGIMQVNYMWHGTKVSSPYELLDPEINVHIGASILADTLKSSPSDIELGIGRYFSWKEPQAREYASKVITIYNNIKEQEYEW